eukprot:comp6604_c0_seq1/m.2377 comp6604_c0_seq1/g.2377  ORF comp6604_c0_seq1/g.2377 comp6604_c0_seq1/m.2377 type:complete len:247 (-) comp6604_c0_seq1:47-787(-)
MAAVEGIRPREETDQLQRDFTTFLLKSFKTIFSTLNEKDQQDKADHEKKWAKIAINMEESEKITQDIRQMERETQENREVAKKRAQEISLAERQLQEHQVELEAVSQEKELGELERRAKAERVGMTRMGVHRVLEEKEDGSAGWEHELELAQRLLSFRIYKLSGGCPGVQVVYSKLDASDPQREFSFCLSLTHSGFVVDRCQPPIEGVTELERQLNETGNTAALFCLMHAKFREAAAHEALVRLRL